MSARSELSVRSATGGYRVVVADGAFDELLADVPADRIIADAYFTERLAGALYVEAVEERKNLVEVERLIAALRDRGASRGDELVAVGGGIVQDVATAAAALYMRGLPWRYAPTTLLGMVDSCIGGKSSLNVGPYKNLAGNFHPPSAVVVDPRFLETLSPEDVAGGLAEAMKISFCRGPEAFETYLDLYASFQAGASAGPLIHHSLAAKSWFIEVDEFDRAERRQLNLGHTFGHALEAATAYELSHGIAVGLGVLCAERVAAALDGEAAEQPVLRDHALHLVRSAPRLAEHLAELDRERFSRAFLSDKKHTADGLRLILPTAAGRVVERQLARGPGIMSVVEDALDETIGLALR